MKRFPLALVALLALAPLHAHGQSAPAWISYGYTPTAGQLRAAFTAKQDLLPYTPLSTTGGTMSGKLNTAPSTVNGSGFSILPGVAPTSPANGDAWVTSAGFFVRVNNQTVTLINQAAVAITGGTINGTTIGGTTPASGTFTTLAANSLSGLTTPLSAAQGGTGYTSVSTALDGLFSSTQGAILYRGASAWQGLAPTTAGYVLSTNGPSANPSWIALPSGAAVLPLGQVRLTYSSSTALLVKPYNGNQITVNGAYQTVPSAGVTCSNTGLTAATLYYAYVYVTGGTLTCEMVTTTHTTGTSGLEIKSGDATRTLVGMAYTAAGSPGTFADSATFRGVASWFNRQGKTLEASVSGASTSSTTPAANATLTVTFVAWADEVVQQNASGLSSNNTVGNYSQTQFMIDGATVGANGAGTNQVSNANYFMNAGMARSGTVSEAAHSATIALSVNGGTGAFSLNHTVGIRQ